MGLTNQAIIDQSKNALAQWKEQWDEHAIIHSDYKMKSLGDFQNIGVGKALVLVATGYSLEQNIETLKKHRKNVDIICCDKSLGMLIDQGIYPDVCVVCDANVNYEKYLEPWRDRLAHTKLLMNVCGNPTWTKEGNWKDKYFFVNEDAIQSEIHYKKLSKCPNQIPAGTNVSNCMVILACQSRNEGRQNLMGYDKILLLGFDYCWHPEGNYYAFNKDGEGKRYYMKHVNMMDKNSAHVYTSNNLLFSAQWAEAYINNFRLPIVNCSDHSILGSCPQGKLEKHIGYRYKVEDGPIVRSDIKRLFALKKETSKLEGKLNRIGNDHWRNYQLSL